MTKLDVRIANNRLVTGQFGDVRFSNWGVECSDRHSFVTLTDIARNAHQTDGIWHLSGGRLKIDLETRLIEPDVLSIQARFTALDDIALQDAVVRLVFDRQGIDHGVIADKKYRHTNSDKYRLHSVDHAQLTSTSGKHVLVTLKTADGAERFAPYLYLRDRDDHWIIHARFLPQEPVDHVWLRWANRFFTLSAPDCLARLLWHFGPTRNFLWRLRERMGRNWPEFQAIPLNKIWQGQSLSLEVTCHFR